MQYRNTKLILCLLLSVVLYSCASLSSKLNSSNANYNVFSTDSEYTGLQYKDGKITGKVKFDKNGRMIATVDSRGYYERTYDEYGNINYCKRIDNGNVAFEHYYQYSKDGEKLYEKDAINNLEGRWHYFPNGELEYVTVSDGKREWYSYKVKRNDNGLISNRIDLRIDGSYLTYSRDSAEELFEYDENNNLICWSRISLNPENKGKVIYTEKYTYPDGTINYNWESREIQEIKDDTYSIDGNGLERWNWYNKDGYDYISIEKQSNIIRYKSWMKHTKSGKTITKTEVFSPDGSLIQSDYLEFDAGQYLLHSIKQIESHYSECWW